MDAHRVLMNKIYDLTGVMVGHRNYCYSKTKDGKPCIELDFEPCDYEETHKVKKIVTEDFIFKRGKKTEELSNGNLCVYFTTEVNPQTDYTDYTDPIDIGEKQYGVICPKGNFYACCYAGHNNLEYWLQQRNLIGEVRGYGTDAYEMEGWVKLSGAMMSTVEAVFQEKVTEYDFGTKEDKVLATHKITKEQVDALVKYIKGRGKELINYNYYWYNIEDFELILTTTLDHFEFQDKYGMYTIEDEENE